MNSPIFIDSFSSLDDLKKKDRKNPEKVKTALKAAGRFSCFEVCDALAPTLDALKEAGEIEYTGGEYPWTTVSVWEEKQ